MDAKEGQEVLPKTLEAPKYMPVAFDAPPCMPGRFPEEAKQVPTPRPTLRQYQSCRLLLAALGCSVQECKGTSSNHCNWLSLPVRLFPRGATVVGNGTLEPAAGLE